MKKFTFRVPYTLPKREVAECVIKGESEKAAQADAIHWVRQHIPGAIVHDPEVIDVETLGEQ